MCGGRELSVPFPVAQRVKKPPAMQETWVWSWVEKIALRREWQSIPCPEQLRFPNQTRKEP